MIRLPKLTHKLKFGNPFGFLSGSIRNKLLSGILLVALIPLLSLGIVAYRISSDALMKQAGENLAAMRSIKSDAIKSYYQERRNDLIAFADTMSSYYANAFDQLHVIQMNKKRALEGYIQKNMKSGVSLSRSDVFIDNLVADRSGLGFSGETYLVGMESNQLVLKSNQRSSKARNKYLKESPWAKKALNGQSGLTVSKGWRNEYLITAYTPLNLTGGRRWAMVSTMSAAEIVSPQKKDLVAGYKKKYRYENVFLIGRDGYVYHSAKHGMDRYTNLLNGPLKKTNLGDLITRVTSTRSFGAADFKHYRPSRNIPAAFMAQPVIANDGIQLIVAVQLSLDQINSVTKERNGLGETGETYLVGTDRLWRSDSYYLKDLEVFTTVLNPKTKVDTKAVRAALKGKKGTGIIKNYRGIDVLSSWQPLTIMKPNPVNPKGLKWAVITEMALGEIKKPVRNLAMISFIVLAIAVFLVIGMALVTTHGLTRQIRLITDLFAKIGMGDFEARTEVVSNDELGKMAISLNAILDNTLTLIQSREERDEIQASITKLLGEISTLTEGNLTARAEVTEAITGAIADSFNDMAEQLSRIVRDVKITTVQVGDTSAEISTATDELIQSSTHQSKQVAEVMGAITQMSKSIQDVARHAVRSSEVSEKSKRNAKDGAEAVRSTNMAMEAIRDRVQETARSIKRLGESSQEIGNVVQIIDDIADRTSILALNASIQAAMAGDAGRGFAVVAEEVQRLAERSTNSTKQIETLVKNIQGEISEAGAKMEESIQRVVEGSKLADGAHEKLEEIEKVSSQLAQLVQSISEAARQQAQSSQWISKTMQDVGQTSSQTSRASRQTIESMEKMAAVAQKLSDSVEAFKLPEQAAPENQLNKTNYPETPTISETAKAIQTP